MNISLTMAMSAWRPCSQSDISSTSSHMSFSNSEKNWFNWSSELSSLDTVVISFTCSFLLRNLFSKDLINLHCLSLLLWDLDCKELLWWGTVGQSFYKWSPWHCQHFNFSSLRLGCCVSFVDDLLDL